MLTSRRLALVGAIFAAGILAVSGIIVVTAGNGKSELAEAKRAVNQYRDPAAAEAAGWVLIEGLDHCFEHPDGGMGIHYIDGARIDTELDPLAPEALVFQHLPNGKLQLGAVEYIVDREAWDALGTVEHPMVLGQHLHPHDTLPIYVLHAWIFKNNPAGLFEDWNPKVTCPAN
ncbi:MAG TPA: hypothetical protein PJ994_08390 [Tepidiformaceae bacterium]|nr:hypothetical protein [Tepidiformaceae bacterium]